MIDYGAIVVSVETPDRDGKLENITLGFSNLEGYLQRHPYFGATVGRYGNRIAKGKFSLEGQEYTLATNNDANHLHGGITGFDRVMWQAEGLLREDAVGIRFQRRSAGRRGGLSGQSGRHGGLHADQRQLPGGGLYGDDRQADARESDQPQLLESGGGRSGHDSGP